MLSLSVVHYLNKVQRNVNGPTQTPHVDGCAIRQPQDDLRGAVEPGLDVSIDPLVGVAGTSKVDHLYGAATTLLQQYVLLGNKIVYFN